MATDHYEVQHFPQGKITLKDNQRVRKLRCAWSDIDALYNELFLSAYPYDTSGVVATQFSFRPWENSRQSQSASPTASYDHAEVTVIYDNSVSGSGSTLVREITRPFSINRRAWAPGIQWGQAPKLFLDESDGIHSPEVGIDMTVTYYRATTIPQTAISQAGLINSGPVVAPVSGVVFPAHTLLYEGYSSDHTVLNTGQVGFTLSYHFKVVYRKNGGVALGWNGHWRSDEARWDTIENFFGGAGGQIKRPEGNFAF